jgi:hypothetical protein
MDQEPPPTTQSPEGFPNFRAFATQVQLRDAAGRSFSTVKDQLTYNTDKLGKYTVFSQYDPPPPDLSGEDTYGRTRFTTADGNVTNLVMIDSRYRDRQAYPQPTLLTLRLPRIYKNVTNITLSDVKLLTSFYFFRLSKANTDITVYEKDRTTFTYEGTLQSTIVKRYITEGSYNIDSLLSEIQLQLNYTPLFFDYINGFDDFVDLFRASGDYSLNFNKPGDFFYDNITNLWIPNPTIERITTQFWNTRYAGLTSYTKDQLLLAYYYPVLNEYLFDEDYLAKNKDLVLTAGIGTYPGVNTTEEVRQHVLYNFLGITPLPDPVALAVINANIPTLEKYRLEHTFRYWLINKYIVNRDTRSQNVYITSPSLNTSLVNLLNSQAALYLVRALQIYGLTSKQYASIQAIVDRTLAVLQTMYSFEQTRFLNYFAVPWSQYTLPYYADLNNTFLVQNGIGAVGIPSNDSQAISSGIIQIDTDILKSLSTEPPYYWPNLKNTSNGGSLASTIYLENLSSATETYNAIYSMDLCNFSPYNTIVESPQDYLYSEYLTKSANVVCPIESAKYTVFKFRSPVRQTLQVETLPRPTFYRLPLYNQSNYDATINAYYDKNYTFSFTPTTPYTPNATKYTIAFDNLASSNLIQIPGWSATNSSNTDPDYSYGRLLSNSVGYYPSSLSLDVTTYNRALYASFTSPEYITPSPSSNYTYTMNLSVQFYSDLFNTSNLVSTNTTYRMFLYHDRAGFQADVLSNRNENPLFYKYSTIIGATESNATIQFTSYPEQEYYVILRPDSSNFGAVYPRITPYFDSTFTVTPQSLSVVGLNPATDILSSNFSTLVNTNFNYAQVYDSNWIRLPINSNLWGSNPSGSPINQDIVISNVPIGYDTNGISTDYTDYIPYIMNSDLFSFDPSINLAVDPITHYQFQSNSPYNSTTQTFLYAGGLNYIFEPGLVIPYYPSLVENREYKICHYYSVNYIPESDSNIPLASGLISGSSNAQLPYTISTTLGVALDGYTYGGGSQSTLQLSKGPLGFNFIPDEGVWDVKRIMFRSAIDNSNADPNKDIKYLGVYNMGAIISTNVLDLSLSTAITVLSNTSRISYTSTNTYDTMFDTKGGTYYEFTKDSNFIPQLSTSILGYTQGMARMSDQPESMYTCIAFTEYGTPIPIKALSGSAIPYPFYNNPFVSTTYLDGTPAFNSNQSVLFPSTIGPDAWPFVSSISSLFAPPDKNDGTQSQYALSIPIGTSVLNYKRSISPSEDNKFLQPWTTTLTPTNIIANVSNYVMLQDTNFNFYKYDLLETNRTFETPTWTLSPDQVYPSYEFTSLVGIAANNSHVYFLGFSNDANVDFKLRMKRYHPYTGVLYDYNLDNSFVLPLGGVLKGFTINNDEQIVMAYQDSNYSTCFYYNLQASSIMYSTTYLNLASTATMTMDSTTSTLYWMPVNTTTNFGKSVYTWSIDNAGAFPGTEWTLNTTPPTPIEWSGIAVNAKNTIPQADDRVFLISQTPTNSNVYFTSNWNTMTTTWDIEPIGTAITTVSGAGQEVDSIIGGYNGSVWITAANQKRVWANRNSVPDVNGIIDSAWQIFYPFQKIIMEKIANSYNSIVDLNTIDYPEYPHTAMFYYRDATAYNADTKHKWGLESSSNFIVSDPNMSGYYFNSYIFNVPLVKSQTSNDYQYLTVRGYTPTETSETLLRFNLPNVYDFGYATQLDLINEIALYSTSTADFNSNYGWVLSNFDISFQQSNSYFGQGLIPNFDGSNFDSSNFQQFASNVSTIYQGYQSNAALLSNITNYVNSNIQLYISTQLRYIMPQSVLGRTNYTDPIVFSLLWKSGLLPQYANLLEDWGLGYNLGYTKMDTPFSTYHRATSFYKILDDYIFLRLNPQYQLNRMDNTFKENFKITRDPTGQVQNFHGKLLLNNFNTYSQSFIYNNQPFNPPIGRLDQVYFQWVNIVGDTIDNNDCDWSATLVITENKSTATTASTIPALPPMNPPRK